MNFIILFWHSTVLLCLLYLAFFSIHPVFLCLLLIPFSLVSGFVLNSFVSQWLMIAIVLIFLGGMMVIFMYCSFMSNEDKLSSVKVELSWVGFAGILWVLWAFQPLVVSRESGEISFFTQSANSQVIWFLLLYLILTLVLAVVFTKSFMGAMKSHDF